MKDQLLYTGTMEGKRNMPRPFRTSTADCQPKRQDSCAELDRHRAAACCGAPMTSGHIFRDETRYVPCVYLNTHCILNSFAAHMASQLMRQPVTTGHWYELIIELIMNSSTGHWHNWHNWHQGERHGDRMRVIKRMPLHI